ncbi:MAG: oxaloacetate decarboxylase subunit alpha [Hydrogenobaculum sp.]|nr:MAG: oxaloacetate decarboxylase subunit alpha [Hydrogenobaculum sp.]
MEKLYFTDVSLRDGIQSLLATRVRTEDMLPTLEILDKCGFWSLEVWGGATFDVCLRYLKEDPWERLKQFKNIAKNTKLEMLLRGQNIVGYRNYPDDVVEAFVKKSYDNGIEVFRIFDALNDVRNMRKAIETAKSLNAIVKGVLSYTTSPVHTVEYYVKIAKDLVNMGIDIISIKDQAGILTPKMAFDLVKALKQEFKLPVHVHTQTTAELANMAQLKALEAGATMFDTAFYSLSSQTSHPSGETMIYVFREFGYQIDVDQALYEEAGNIFREVRKKYKKYDTLPPYPDVSVLTHQVPGGMISNFISQLREQNLEDKLEEVLKEVARVREDLGYPPLVTPTSQMVGSQAFLNVVNKERYKVVTKEIKDYVKGLYGKPPAPIKPEIMELILKDEKDKTYFDIRPADLLQNELEEIRKEAYTAGARNEEDVLSYAILPVVAKEFFEWREKFEKGLVQKEIEYTYSDCNENVPVEFNVAVHGEQFNIKIVGREGMSEDRKIFFVRINDQLEEVAIEPIKEISISQQKVTSGDIPEGISVKPKRPKAQDIGDISSNISGKVVDIKVSIGDRVKEGDTLLIVEAMKMENEIKSTIDGQVEEILVEIGEVINPGEVLIRLKPEFDA